MPTAQNGSAGNTGMTPRLKYILVIVIFVSISVIYLVEPNSVPVCAQKTQTITTDILRKRKPGRFIIIAHRGFSAAYEDNSLEAFKAAIAAGADLIEADVRQSDDHIIVLSHDDVDDDTMKDLAKEGIIPLESLLKLAKGKIALLFDMKEDEPALLNNVLDMVQRHGMKKQVVFGLRSVETTRAFRKLNSQIPILGFLPRHSYYFSDFFAAGGDIARIWEPDIDAKLVIEARGGGARPIWITARSRPELTGELDSDRQEALMKQGFDGVLVNDPELAVEVRCVFAGH